ncbi:MAG: ATP-dependent DNA ligase [Verrucomicrobia bacterium]|nr:ATP-dependent DNA ligase [Verrucomicrobiota bacterium]
MPLRFDPKSLHFPDLEMWLDPHRPRPFAFVSHGHADHFARHQRVLCSPGTGHILVKRYGVKASTIEALDWGEQRIINDHHITLYPAGHITGSAMIRIEGPDQSILYTGDFKTRSSHTAELVDFPKSDILIMETTFGRPQFVFPPTDEIEKDISRFARETLDDGETPIFLAYSLGKAQEALAILNNAGIEIVVHKTVFEMTQACRDLKVDLPKPVLLEKNIPPGVAVIAPPNAVRARVIRSHKKRRTAMLSGWALTPGSRYRYQVDQVFPLSDHADYPGLLESVEKVSPSLVYTLHGSTREFARDLRAKGIEAWSIYGDDQLELLESASPEISPKKKLPRPSSDLRDLSELLESLTTTASRLKKIQLLSTFLQDRTNQELPLVTRWLSGSGITHLGNVMIRQALLEVTGFPLAKYKTVSASQNDSARTARLLLEEAPLNPLAHSSKEVATYFDQLRRANGSLAKTHLLSCYLYQCHPAEGETMVRLLTGGLRAGAKEGLYEEAVAQAFDVSHSAIRYAAMLTGDLGEVAIAAKNKTLAEIQLRPGTPIKPMLASPTETAEDIIKWHDSKDIPLWLEPKYDGIRSQLHVTPDGAHLFSRDLRSLDDEFPEILEAARALPPCLLDGELIAYAEGKRLTFFDLQKRLGRKKIQGDLFLGAAIPVKFMAFDCLYSRKALIDAPLEERRQALESLELSAPFTPVPLIRPDGADIEALEREFKKAMSDDNEGLIAKNCSSSYQPGRRGQSWKKLKGVMPTLDCVVIAAQQGHGKRSGVLSDYTFAVRDKESGELRTLGKAYSGLTDDEIEDLTDHFQKTTIERISRRVVKVEPTIVLEIAFDKIRPSKRHDSGLALRFPRIKAIRRDKSLDEIDTLQTAQKLV